MEKKYLDLTLNDFLDVITHKELTYEMSFEDDQDPTGFSKISGTKSQFVNFLDEQIKVHGIAAWIQKLYRDVDKLEPYAYSVDLGDLEIYNYLEKHTNSFDAIKVKMMLQEIDCYYNMDYLERVNSESTDYYLGNGIEIPMIEISNCITGEKISIPDYKQMRQKTHRIGDWSILRAMSMLKSKINTVSSKPFNHRWEDNHLTHIANSLLELNKIDNINVFISVMNGKQGCIDWRGNKTDLKVFLSYFCRQIKYNTQKAAEIIPNSKFPLKEANLLFNVNREKLTKGSFEIPFQNEYDKIFATIF